MKQPTQKEKIEKYDALVRERDLLERYFWDMASGDLKPDASFIIRTERDGYVFQFRVYQTMRGHGGYIVVTQRYKREKVGVPELFYWDAFQEETNRSTDYVSEYMVARKRACGELRQLLKKNESTIDNSTASLA